MKKIILFTGLGIIMATTKLMGADNLAQDFETKHSSYLPHKGKTDSRVQRGPTGDIGPKGVTSPGVLGVLSASSTLPDSSTNSSGLTYFLEFNTNFRNMSFSTLDDLGFTSQSSFTLSGPGEFLIEASGIITITSLATLGQRMGISLQFLGTDDEWHAIFPGLSFNWIPPFAAPAGTAIGFKFSRSVQLIKGEVSSYRIAYFNNFSSGATITNKTLTVTQTQE